MCFSPFYSTLPPLSASLSSGAYIGESLKAIYARAIFYLPAEGASRLDDSCFASSTTTHSSRAATALLSPFSFHRIYTHQHHFSTACFVLLPFLSSPFASTSCLTPSLAPPSLRTHHPGLGSTARSLALRNGSHQATREGGQFAVVSRLSRIVASPSACL